MFVRPALISLAFLLAVPALAQDRPILTLPGDEMETGEATTLEPVSETPLSADQLLEPFYEQLRRTVEMPVAPTGAALPGDQQILTRIAFGSCNHQSRSQHMWAQIERTDPDLFLLIGDNVYGDYGWAGDASLASLRAAYAEQSSHPEFQSFRAQVPMMTTWDDHDYGLNDAGAAFSFKSFAEDVYENYWGVPAEVRDRPGIHQSQMFGPEGERVQIILLDTRFFRSELKTNGYQDPRPPLGPYVPDENPELEMLGDEQFAWLEGELAKPADLRILVSSIQVLTDAHQYEAWATLPAERRKLLSALADRNGGGLVMLSGDRHAGGIYNAASSDYTEGGSGEQLWEITSSSLNLAFSTTEQQTEREPDDRRVSDFIGEENFGLVEIDWPRQELRLELRGNQGEVRASQTIGW